MQTQLRPMTLGEILDRTAYLYRSNFLLFAGIASVYAGAILVVGLVEVGLSEWMRVAHMVKAQIWLSGTSVLVAWLFIFLFGGIAGAANNRAVSWLHLGEPATIRGAYRSVLPLTGRYLWLELLKLIFAWSPALVLYAGMIAATIYFQSKGLLGSVAQPAPAAPPTGPALAFFGIVGILALLLFPAAIYGTVMSLRYALAVPACVVENIKARAAIRRSVMLSQQARGRIFVLGLLVTIIAVGLTLLTQSLFFVEAYKHRAQLPVGWRVAQQIVSFFNTTFVAPILATGLTLFYYDQRVRKEGFDIEWMMQAAGLTVPLPVPPAPLAENSANPESSPAEPGSAPAGDLQ